MIKGSHHTEKARKLLVISTRRAHRLGLRGKGKELYRINLMKGRWGY
jgi:hypothetical protein